MCVAALVEPAASGKVSGALRRQGEAEAHQPVCCPTPPVLFLLLNSTQPRRLLRSSRSRTPPPAPSPSSSPPFEAGTDLFPSPGLLSC